MNNNKNFTWLILIIILSLILVSCDDVPNNNFSAYEVSTVISAYNSLILKFNSAEDNVGLQYNSDTDSGYIYQININDIEIEIDGLVYKFNGEFNCPNVDSCELNLNVSSTSLTSIIIINLLQTSDSFSFTINDIDYSNRINGFNLDELIVEEEDDEYVFHERYIENIIKALSILMASYNTDSNNIAYLDEFDDGSIAIKFQNEVYTFVGNKQDLVNNCYKLDLTVSNDNIDTDVIMSVDIDDKKDITSFNIDSHNYTNVLKNYNTIGISTTNSKVVNLTDERNLAFWLSNNYLKFSKEYLPGSTSSSACNQEDISNPFNRTDLNISFEYNGNIYNINGYNGYHPSMTADWISKSLTITSTSFIKSYTAITKKINNYYYQNINGETIYTYIIQENANGTKQWVLI